MSLLKTETEAIEGQLERLQDFIPVDGHGRNEFPLRNGVWCREWEHRMSGEIVRVYETGSWEYFDDSAGITAYGPYAMGLVHLLSAFADQQEFQDKKNETH